MNTVTHVLFVFIDGVGLGSGGEQNPLTQNALPAFEKLAGGQAWTNEAHPLDCPDHVFRPIDATLGVEGLPQSGTGQTALFSGVNAPQLAGRHFGPYPHSKTRDALAEKNVFARVHARFPDEKEPAAFANAYPPRFFSYAKRTDRWTVTTRCCLDAGVPIRGLEMLREGRALAAGLTGEGWQRLGLDVTPVTEATAAEHLHAISQAHRFTLFEYFLTDKAGHSRDAERAAEVLRSLDRLFAPLLEAIAPDEELLLVTSDHGNLEDLSTKTHTRHPVPLVAYGRGAHHFASAQGLTDVTPSVLRLFEY